MTTWFVALKRTISPGRSGLAVLMLISLSAASILSGCNPSPTDLTADADLGQARQALEAYLAALQAEDYTAAASYYGGSTGFLQDSNPDLDPQDTAQLLRNGCRINGLQCLPARAISEGLALEGGVYIFDVQFNTREGELFERGPCCGANETEMPTQSIFSFKVQHQAGRFVVLDLPPYVP